MNNTQSAQIIRAGSVSNSSQSSGSGSTFSRSPSGPRRTVADTGLGTFFQHPFGMYMCLKRETGRDACSPFHVDAQNILTCLHTHDATFPPTEPLPHTGYNGKTWRKSGTGVEASPSAVHSILAPSCLNRTSSLPHHVLRTVNARPLHASTLMAQNNSHKSSVTVLTHYERPLTQHTAASARAHGEYHLQQQQQQQEYKALGQVQQSHQWKQPTYGQHQQPDMRFSEMTSPKPKRTVADTGLGT